MPTTKRVSQSPKARKSATATANPEWTPEQKQQIAELAYGYFLSRGCQHGGAMEDWLKAEADFAGRLAPKRRGKTNVVPIAV